MELSLNISEDENCTFITSNLLEQSENFDEWLDKNGVHFIISNERHSDNTTISDNGLDPLLIQLKDVIAPNEEEDTTQTENQNNSTINFKFTTLKCKSEYLESLLKKTAVYVTFQVDDTKVKLTFTNSNNKIVYNTSYINLNEVGGRLIVPKEKEHIVSCKKVLLIDDLDALMPCLTLATGLKLFMCPKTDCNSVHTRITAAKLHCLMQLEHKPYKCNHENCTWAFYTMFKLRRHQESHNNHKDFICTVKNCNRRFTNIYNLNIHVKSHTRPATLHCPVKNCVEKFQTSRLREKHFKSHDVSDAPFVCPENNCSRAFFVITGLQSHARSHAHKESDMRCDYPNCGKVFKLPCRLREHARLHTGHRPYICDYDGCTWSFTSSSKLRRHQSSHKNERKFHCTIGDCAKSFLRPEHLKEHTLTHIGPRISSCEVCTARFYGISSKASLYLHIKKFHPEINQCARSVPFAQQESTSNSSESLTSNVNSNSDSDSQTQPQIISQDQAQRQSQHQQQEHKPTADLLLEQAIQSLGVPSDMILGTGLIPEESLELLENGNFSTVNLRDLE